MDLILDGLNYRVQWGIEEGSFEAKERAQQTSLADIDSEWAVRINAALLECEQVDWVGSDTLLTALRVVSAGLRTQIAIQGVRGLVVHDLIWTPLINTSLEYQAGLDSAALVSIGQQDLGAQFRYFALEEPKSYIDDIVIPSLTGAAERKIATQDLSSRLLGLVDAQKGIVASPRELMGNRRAYVVRPGDTLRDIAFALYQEYGYEQELIDERQLQPPFVSETPRAGCIQPGARILRPSHSTPNDDSHLLGSTFALDVSHNGTAQDWDLLPLPGGGIDYVSGMDCLATDAALRIATPLGTLSGENRYGYPDITGRPLSRVGMAEVILAAETLLEDDRIESVFPRLSGRATVGGGLFQNITIVPKRK